MNENIMAGKICLITGANSGIGKAMTVQLAKYGATIIMVCRNSEKGELARQEITEKSGNKNIHLVIIDLSMQQSIREGVSKIKQRFNKIDVLINNAGTLIFKKILTEDNIETMFAVNYLAPFLLTRLLQDLLVHADNSRIINVVSEGTKESKIDLENLQSEKKFNPVLAYSQSKQAEIFFTYELAERLKMTKIKVNCFYPGLVQTNLGKAEKGFSKFTHALMSKLLKNKFVPIEKSVEIGIFLAISPKAEKLNGKYLKRENDKIIINSGKDSQIRKELWEISENLIQ